MVPVVLALAAAVATAGCTSRELNVRQSLGLDQNAPDEFLVVTKAPLTIPPDMQLMPPEPGAAGPGNDPSIAAKTAALGTAGANRTATASSGEQAVLSRAGVGEADPTIRRRLMAETLEAREAKGTVRGRLLDLERGKDETLDPAEEAERLRRQRTGRRIQAEDILPGAQ